ncbi:MAG: TonB-dependent receptor plug domain-containing protein [Cyclobacteriaceae bacterium]|nr:TonB-dependent receptor plug domain-containing protein [Cyclobacteriaceae bacterium]
MKIILVIGWIVAARMSFGQDPCVYTLRGKILDAEGNALPGATVLLDGTGTSSAADGQFIFNHLCAGSYSMEVRFVGFDDFQASVMIPVREDIVIRLKPSIMQLEKVEVFGQASFIAKSNTSLSIASAELDQLTGKTLGESLKSLPGISSLQSGPAVFKPIIQGLHSQRILILNNGIRQEGQQWGVEHAPEIDPFIANEITVVKGSESVRYGADALGGVIIINTPSIHQAREFKGELHTGFMTNNRMGIVSGLFEGGFKNSDKWNWRLQGTGKKGGDFSTPNYVLSNTGLEELNFSGAVGFKDSRQGLEIYGSSFNTQLGILRAAHTGNLNDLEQSIQSKEPWYIAPFTYDINNPYQQINHQLLKVKAFRQLPGLGTLHILYGGQYNQRKEYDVRRSGRSSRPSLFMNLISNVLDISIDHEHAAHTGSVGTNLTYKYNFNKTGETGRNPLVPDYHQFNAGLFAIEKITRSRWSLEAGARYDFQYLQVLTFDQSKTLLKPEFYFNYFSGSLGASYFVRPDVRISSHLATSTRPPHVSELYSNGLHHGTGAIEEGLMIKESEVLTASDHIRKEVSTKWINTLQLGKEKITADFSAYVNPISNYVYVRPVGSRETISGFFPVWRYEQTDALLAGFDLLVNWTISEKFSATGKYAYLYAQDMTRNDYLIFIPPMNAEAGLTYSTSFRKNQSLYVKVAVPVVWEQYRAPITVYPSEIPNYTGDRVYDIAPAPPGFVLLTAEAGIKLPVGEQELSISLAGENLTNEVYRNYMNRLRYFADEVGRNFTVRLNYKFNNHK